LPTPFPSIAKLSTSPKSQASVVKEVKAELEKATTRAGEEMGQSIKEMLAEAVQTVDKTTADWVKKKVRETNPETGESWRAPYGGSSAKTHGGEKLVFAHAAPNGNDRGEVITDPDELGRMAELTGDTESGLGRFLTQAQKNGGSAFRLSNFGFMLPEAANKKGEDGNFLMPGAEMAQQFTGQNAGRTLSPIIEEWLRIQGITMEEALANPETAARLKTVIDNYGSAISDEILALPEHFGEAEFYEAVRKANERVKKNQDIIPQRQIIKCFKSIPRKLGYNSSPQNIRKRNGVSTGEP
jgi:hypothetical protein